MPKLPELRYRQYEKVLLILGFSKRTTKSSHIVFIHQDGRRTVVPNHPKSLPKGTAHSIIRQMGISAEEFLKLL
jgi:predicted RNA binding protein YcfA (HicA-like mRNA interferase family)